jgi:hypothetical protein
MVALLCRKPAMTPATAAVVINMTVVYDLEKQSLKWGCHVFLKHWYPFSKVHGVTSRPHA